MKRGWVLSQEDFDRLLHWLDANLEAAGREYETIRERLIKIFARRGCAAAEDLADETINRVTAKLETIIDDYEGSPRFYFYRVAQLVHMEYLKRPKPPQVNWDLPAFSEEKEREYECLDDCLERLSSDQRELVLQYYQKDKRAKIEGRQRLAEQLGIAVNALRIRAHRIRSLLQQCLNECLEEQSVH